MRSRRADARFLSDMRLICLVTSFTNLSKKRGFCTNTPKNDIDTTNGAKLKRTKISFTSVYIWQNDGREPLTVDNNNKM